MKSKFDFTKRILWLAGMLAITFVLSGCDNNSMNPESDRTSGFPTADFDNVVWTLAAFEKAGRDVDIVAFPPFHLIFEANAFFGDDGCNWFSGLYEAHNDSIFPGPISQTLRLCGLIGTFPVQHLAAPYRLEITETKLRIFTEDEVYTYKSDVAEDIENSPLTGNWQLSNSSDPEFAEIQKQQLIPTLTLEQNRKFRITWYCDADNSFGCDEIAGIFGIGAGGKIFFYQRDGSYHGQGPGENFMQRILASAAYTVKSESPKGSTLTLFNEMHGTNFEFKSINRSVPTSSDTLELAYKDTLFDLTENFWLTFDSLLADSRCPINVDCIWEGNVELAFIFSKNEERRSFTLNTSGNFNTSATVLDHLISLIDVQPVPHTDSVYVADDYVAKVVISKCE